VTATRSRPSPRPPERRPPVLLIAGLVVLALVGLGLVFAFTGGDDGATTASDAPAYGRVTVDGSPLPTFEETEGDAAAGTAAPGLEGEAPDGSAVSVGGAAEQPTLVAFLAHWCPHCNRELPVLVDLAEQGAFDGVRTVAVLTGTNPAAPNYPPVAWLEEAGWTGDVLLDDEAATAASAYGLAGYPFLVLLDSNGDVVARASGELPADALEALVSQAS
jgi:thiol-disulfide isomerase/thioredoxin